MDDKDRPIASAAEDRTRRGRTIVIRCWPEHLTGAEPILRGTIRDHTTQRRRPFLRFFACEQDLSHDSPDAPLPDAVATGMEPFLVVGAMAGG